MAKKKSRPRVTWRRILEKNLSLLNLDWDTAAEESLDRQNGSHGPLYVSLDTGLCATKASPTAD